MKNGDRPFNSAAARHRGEKMYSTKQIDDAMRSFMRWLDTDGTKQALEDLLAQGEVEIAGINDGGFVFRLVNEPGETS